MLMNTYEYSGTFAQLKPPGMAGGRAAGPVVPWLLRYALLRTLMFNWPFVCLYFRQVSASCVELRSEAKCRIFYISNISSVDSDRDVVVGVVLDQPRGDVGKSGAR